MQLTWNDAVAFCRWLSEKEQATYRLPTEAEWEYACRAGNPRPWSKGENYEYVNAIANIADQAIREHYVVYAVATEWNDTYPFSAPIEKFQPNLFGLFDMHGNAFEWCADWFDGQYYAGSPGVDPKGPESGKGRVQRGGSFLHHVDDSRSAHRDSGAPDEATSCVGFRILRTIEE